MLSRATFARHAHFRHIVRKRFSDAPMSDGLPMRPVRKQVSPQEREALRAARKEQAAKVLKQQSGGESLGSHKTSSAVALSSKHSRWVWYIGVSFPTALLVWGFNDENSPPAKLSRVLGLTALIQNFSEDFAKPSHDKLLPDWSQVCYPVFFFLSSIVGLNGFESFFDCVYSAELDVDTIVVLDAKCTP